MNYKIFVAGVWGFGNISIMEQFHDDEQVEFLKHDFVYFHQMMKAWDVVNRWLKPVGGKILRLLLKTRIFDDKYALSHCDYDGNEVNYVVIFNSALLQYYSREYFKRLKRKHPSIRYILYIIDPMPEGLWKEIEDALEVFERVFTIHPYNCKKYGFGYLPYIYTRCQEKSVLEAVPETTLFFCGVSGSYRQKIISEVVKACDEHQIEFDFWLKPFGNDAIIHPQVHYSEMTYAENVQRVEYSKCILEIMHEGFVGITQRYLEAIIYNKRLITNNREIKELPYYDSKYMLYFEKVEEIDWNWLKQEVKVDYHYQGDFEPHIWKKNLMKLMNNGEL